MANDNRPNLHRRMHVPTTASRFTTQNSSETASTKTAKMYTPCNLHQHVGPARVRSLRTLPERARAKCAHSARPEPAHRIAIPQNPHHVYIALGLRLSSVSHTRMLMSRCHSPLRENHAAPPWRCRHCCRGLLKLCVKHAKLAPSTLSTLCRNNWASVAAILPHRQPLLHKSSAAGAVPRDVSREGRNESADVCGGLVATAPGPHMYPIFVGLLSRCRDRRHHRRNCFYASSSPSSFVSAGRCTASVLSQVAHEPLLDVAPDVLLRRGVVACCPPTSIPLNASSISA